METSEKKKMRESSKLFFLTMSLVFIGIAAPISREVFAFQGSWFAQLHSVTFFANIAPAAAFIGTPFLLMIVADMRKKESES